MGVSIIGVPPNGWLDISLLVVVDKSNLLRSKIATLALRLSAVQCAG